MITHTDTGNHLLSHYQRAKRFYDGILDLDKLALNTTIVPHWITGTQCFWYRRKTWQGAEFRLVDANAASNKEAFDHQALATALTDSSGETVEAHNLPITNVEISLSPAQLCFSAFDRHFTFDIHQKTLKETPPDTLAHDNSLISPDGRQAAFIKDHNLWLQNLETGEEWPLTHDGEPNYAYATSPVALGITVNTHVQALWSPDSKRLLTLQTDRRQVKTIPMLHHIPADGSLRPQVEEQHCAYLGDEHVEEIRLLSIELETGKLQDANYRRIPVKRTGHGLFSDQLVWWSQDSSLAYFVDIDRDGKTAKVVELEPHSGSARFLFEETSSTYIQFNNNEMMPATLRALPDTDEIIWYSDRSGWAHLYLYDLKTGALKHPITEGEWLVRDILHVDIQQRELWIQTAGREANRDPYYRDICRVNIDSGELINVAGGDREYTVLAPGNIDHYWHQYSDPDINIKTSGISPDNCYVVTCHSRIDQVAVSQLLDRNGKVLLDLEESDLSKFPDDWQPPEPVKLKAADNKTAIYGAVFKPSNFSADKQYPVIDCTLGASELKMTPKALLRNDTSQGYFFLHASALAELGFIVLLIDGRGTPYRDKAFLDSSYGWLPSANNTEDRIAGIKQLGEQRSYMDLNRVGLMNFGSDGGSLFRYPDFYKVGVNSVVLDTRLIAAAICGDHLGETCDSENLRAEQLVDKLQGKLLLIHGFLDPILPVASTLRIVEALQKANKDFDLLLLPNLGHGGDADPYVCRRTWDYFVKHLQGQEPPKEFNLMTTND